MRAIDDLSSAGSYNSTNSSLDLILIPLLLSVFIKTRLCDKYYMLIKEVAKQKHTGNRQNLYHYTTLENLKDILRTGMLGLEYNDYRVSFTRNSRYTYGVKSINDIVCLVFDGNILHQRYKMYPYAYKFQKNWLDDTWDKTKYKEENEEVVIGPINIHDGLLDIVIGKTVEIELLGSIERNQKAVEYYSDFINKYEDIITKHHWSDKEALKIVQGDEFSEEKYNELIKRNPAWVLPLWDIKAKYKALQNANNQKKLELYILNNTRVGVV